MIALPAGVQVWLAAGATDMRKGFDGLAGLVQTQLLEDPFSGQLFVFRGRRGDRVKILWWDGDGLCLFAKRLERVPAELRQLVEEQHARLVHQCLGDHHAALHAAGERAAHHVGLFPQLRALEFLFGAHQRLGARDAVETRVVHADVQRLLEHVEVDLLRHDADAGLRALQVAVEVVAEHLHLAGGLVDQRGDDADQRGLAGTVGAQQGEEIASSRLFDTTGINFTDGSSLETLASDMQTWLQAQDTPATTTSRS